MSTLVTFFSAEGTTKAVAEEFAKKIGADCFEIVPTELYTKADINYLNPLSRCNKEQIGKTAEKLGEYIKGAAVLEAKLVHNADEIANW